VRWRKDTQSKIATLPMILLISRYAIKLAFVFTFYRASNIHSSCDGMQLTEIVVDVSLAFSIPSITATTIVVALSVVLTLSMMAAAQTTRLTSDPVVKKRIAGVVGTLAFTISHAILVTSAVVSPQVKTSSLSLFVGFLLAKAADWLIADPFVHLIMYTVHVVIHAEGGDDISHNKSKSGMGRRKLSNPLQIVESRSKLVFVAPTCKAETSSSCCLFPCEQ